MRAKVFIALYVTIGLLASCKKKKQPAESIQQPTINITDSTIQTSDVSYRNGTTWIYSVKNQTETLTYPYPPQSHFLYSTGNYTVVAAYDSLINNKTKAKVLNYYFTANVAAIKELQYIDPSSSILHREFFDFTNGNVKLTAAITIPLPLTTNMKWDNLYYPLQSTIANFKTVKFERLSLKVGMVDCLKFESGDAGNIYWYNKRMGTVYAESYRISSPNFGTNVIESSTITLTKFR